MITYCAHCNAEVVADQPLCTECGAPVSAPHPSPSPSPPGRDAPQTQTRVKRDKARDFELVGQVIAHRYKVLKVLGQGGFGTVYLVEIVAGMVGEKLALKILPEDFSHEPALREQFLNEIRIAMKMVDQNIVQIRDVGTTEGGVLYYTMDFFPGVTLGELLSSQGPLAIDRAIGIARKVARALQTAHSLGIVHRDLKPPNVMVNFDGERDVVRVLDFGIATAMGKNSRDAEERKGFVGSPYYMPPEQFIGEKAGPYSDIYSLGVILYESVTGVKPHPGNTPKEVFQHLKHGPVEDPTALRPEVDGFPGLSRLIMTCLERNPERRIQSAKALYIALTGILNGNPPPELIAQEYGAPRVAAETVAPPPSSSPAPLSPASPPPPQARRASARARRQRARVYEQRRVQEKAGVLIFLGLLLVGGAVVFLNRHRLEELFRAETPPTTIGAEPSKRSRGDGEATGTSRTVTPVEPSKRSNDPQETTEFRAEREKAEQELAAWTRTAEKELETLAAGGDWEAVKQRAQKVLENAPGSIVALRLRGTALRRLGENDAARAVFAELMRVAPPGEIELPTLLEILRGQLEGDDVAISSAVATAEIALERDLKSPETYLLFGTALERQENFERLEKLRALSGKHGVESPELDALWQRVFVERPAQDAAAVKDRIAEASELLAEGKPQEAAQRAVESLRTTDSVKAKLVLARAALAMRIEPVVKNAIARLESHLRESEEIDPADRTASFELLGRLRLVLHELAQDPSELDAARIAFEQCLAEAEALDRTTSREIDARVRLWRAAIWAERGDAELVLEDLKSTRDTRDPQLLVRQARTYMRAAQNTRDTGRQAELFDAARGRWSLYTGLKEIADSERTDGLYQTGVCYLHLGRLKSSRYSYKLATNHFRDAERAGLDTPQLRLDWAEAHLGMGQTREAADQLELAYKLEPNPELCLRLARTLVDVKRQDRALQLLREGITRWPDDEILSAEYLMLSDARSRR